VDVLMHDFRTYGNCAATGAMAQRGGSNGEG
jgi:hypothetical protein